jgi:DNA repair exonuclease SbcCD nuclease subunit
LAKPLRFLHTADWQLGLKLAFVAGDAGAVGRFQRFEVVRKLAQIAKERAVDAVVVAGDVFDDNAVGEDSLQRARDALAAFAPIPVLLLPGNHDAATPDCVLARLGAGAHVHPLLDDTPFVLEGQARFHPCPLRRRHERDDPSRALPNRDAADPARVVSEGVLPREPAREPLILVAIAHGALIDFTEGLESKNVIDWRGVLAKGYDYLALGDWHGTLSFDPRVWYSGAPEPTRFKEKRPGNALIVEIDAPGAVPRVEEIAVARTRWIERRFDLTRDEDVGEVERFFAAVEEPSMTLVSASFAGHVSLGARAKLEGELARARGALMHLRVDTSELHDRPSEEDLRTLAVDGFVGRAAEALRLDPAPGAEDALRLLHRFLIEERR